MTGGKKSPWKHPFLKHSLFSQSHEIALFSCTPAGKRKGPNYGEAKRPLGMEGFLHIQCICSIASPTWKSIPNSAAWHSHWTSRHCICFTSKGDYWSRPTCSSAIISTGKYFVRTQEIIVEHLPITSGLSQSYRFHTLICFMLKCNQRYWSLQKNLTVAVNYQRLEWWAPLHKILNLKKNGNEDQVCIQGLSIPCERIN